jgi:AGCS family alanine or glycine:cation symporter
MKTDRTMEETPMARDCTLRLAWTAVVAGWVLVASPALAGEPTALERQADHLFGAYLVEPLARIFFWKLPLIGMPIVVAWLLAGSIFFTIRMGLVNFRMFGHALELVRGRYDDPGAPGEVSHFQALSTALSATVGLGNIAGVAIAVATGGPGATFWMVVAGLLGMSAKFTEVTLGQRFRHVRPDGSIMGGAMYYLSEGLASRGLPRLGRFLAVSFVILCIGGSFGGGNSFQVKQGLDQIRTLIPFFDTYPWAYGLLMAGLVGMVIIGGIRRIASVADKIVPAMCLIYLAACLWVILTNISALPAAVAEIVRGAFTPAAVEGGFLGCLVIGIRRAAFSNEAGIGSAAIAHSAARSTYPVQEGIVSLLEPFIDTVVVCTMTALVIAVTGVCSDDACRIYVEQQQGAALTSAAMGGQISWFPWVLALAVFLFSYSTMISWSYYGERCWTWLFGESFTIVYRLLFLGFTFLGSVVTATNVLEFSDLMILGMAFPNVLGVLLLSGLVARSLAEYRAGLASGSIHPYA